MISASATVTVRKDASGATRRAVRRFLEDAADRGFAESQERVPVDRGTLLQSGFVPEWRDGRIVWGYRAGHAEPMEYGTGPFTPPIEPLKEWAGRVLGDEDLGYAVQQKIANEGIDAQPFARPGAERQKRWIQGMPFSRYLQREL